MRGEKRLRPAAPERRLWWRLTTIYRPHFAKHPSGATVPLESPDPKDRQARRDALRERTDSRRADHTNCGEPEFISSGVSCRSPRGFHYNVHSRLLTRGLTFLPHPFTPWWMSVNSPSGAAAGCRTTQINLSCLELEIISTFHCVLFREAIVPLGCRMSERSRVVLGLASGDDDLSAPMCVVAAAAPACPAPIYQYEATPRSSQPLQMGGRQQKAQFQCPFKLFHPEWNSNHVRSAGLKTGGEQETLAEGDF